MNRLANAAWLLAGGLIFGCLMTFGHQANLVVGGTTFPWGLLVALLGVASVLVGVRLVSNGRRPAIWFAGGIIVAVFVLAMPGPNGSVLVPNNLAGMIWSLAPTLVAVLIVLWPASRPVSSSRADRLKSVERTHS